MICQGMTSVMPQRPPNQFGFSRCGPSYGVLTHSLFDFSPARIPCFPDPLPARPSPKYGSNKTVDNLVLLCYKDPRSSQPLSPGLALLS